MEKINYVIATWSGKRRVPNQNYLKEHILKLSTLKHNLSQVTIVKPIFNGQNDEYYNIGNLAEELGCRVRTCSTWSWHASRPQRCGSRSYE